MSDAAVEQTLGERLRLVLFGLAAAALPLWLMITAVIAQSQYTWMGTGEPGTTVPGRIWIDPLTGDEQVVEVSLFEVFFVSGFTGTVWVTSLLAMLAIGFLLIRDVDLLFLRPLRRRRARPLDSGPTLTLDWSQVRVRRGADSTPAVERDWTPGRDALEQGWRERIGPPSQLLDTEGELERVLAWEREDHWLLLGEGLTELREKRSRDAEHSGWGAEFTLLCDDPDWGRLFLEELAVWVEVSGRLPEPGEIVRHRSVAHGLAAFAVVPDPICALVHTPNGMAQFLRVVPLHHDEASLARQWDLVALLRELSAPWDPRRPSACAGDTAALQQRARLEGSTVARLHVRACAVEPDAAGWVLSVDSEALEPLREVLPQRLRHARPLELVSPARHVVLRDGPQTAWNDHTLTVSRADLERAWGNEGTVGLRIVGIGEEDLVDPLHSEVADPSTGRGALQWTSRAQILLLAWAVLDLAAAGVVATQLSLPFALLLGALLPMHAVASGLCAWGIGKRSPWAFVLGDILGVIGTLYLGSGWLLVYALRRPELSSARRRP